MKASKFEWTEAHQALDALTEGFPGRLSSVVREALNVIGLPVKVLTGAYQLRVSGESLIFPSRVYFDLRKGEHLKPKCARAQF